MKNRRRKVVLTTKAKFELAESLFNQNFPKGIWVRKNPRKITHYHSYGGLTPFFKGLSEGKLLGTLCESCRWFGGGLAIWLPPRVHCPDCWSEMSWVEINAKDAKVYSHSMANYSGEGFKLSTPCPLISVEIPGVCTKLMSYLSKFSEIEPYIGMPVKPVFRKKNPTYTILDLAWVPID